MEHAAALHNLVAGVACAGNQRCEFVGEVVDAGGEGAQFVAASGVEARADGELAGCHVVDGLAEVKDGLADAARDEPAQGDGGEGDGGGDCPEDHAAGGDGGGGKCLIGARELVGLLHNVVDGGAVSGEEGTECFIEDFAGGLGVLREQRGDEFIFERGEVGLRGLLRGLKEFGFHRAVVERFGPDFDAGVVVTAELLAALSDALNIGALGFAGHREHFHVGLDDVGGRGENVGDEVFAQDDLVVDGSLDADLLDRGVGGAYEEGEAGDGDTYEEGQLVRQTDVVQKVHAITPIIGSGLPHGEPA